MSSPATLLYIRHAATDLAGTFCGSSDPALNRLGLEQVERLVEQLAPEPIQAVCSSNLLRARQTAEAIAASHRAPLQLCPGLRELHFGEWEALTWQQIEVRDPVLAAKWVSAFPDLPSPGGEPISQFRTRIRTALDAIRKVAMAGQTLAVVTHAGPLRILLEEFGHYGPQHAWERTREYTCVIRCTQTSSGTFTICN